MGKTLSFLLALLVSSSVFALKSLDEIQPGACGDHVVMATAIPKISVTCRWSGGCGNSFGVARPDHEVENLRVTAEEKGRVKQPVSSTSLEVRNGTLIFGQEVCLSEGALVSINYTWDPTGPKMALPPIPKW